MEIAAIALDAGRGIGPVEEALRSVPDADLVVLPESALGPFPDGRDAELDRRNAVRIPGPETEVLGRHAASRGSWLAIGLVERDGAALYDSAVLFDPAGAVSLHYRRIHPGWCFPDADRTIYRCGTDLPTATTPFGRTAILICGDLFDDGVADRARALDLDLVLVPLARSLDTGPGGWPAEIPHYAERVARIGALTVLANRSDGEFAGGALVIGADGRVRADAGDRWLSTLVLP